jgi:hypothetical protein
MYGEMFKGLGQLLFCLCVLAFVGLLALLGGTIWLVIWLMNHVSVTWS